MSRLTNVKSNENIIYSYLAFHVCRLQCQQFENCLRTGTAGLRNPADCYQQSKQYTTCAQKKATKLDPISLPIFNDVRQCLFQNDSHIFSCKEELNQLLQSHVNPENYKQMLLASTVQQRQPKKYNSHLFYGGQNLNN